MDHPSGVDTIIYRVSRSTGNYQTDDRVVVRFDPAGGPPICTHCHDVQPDEVDGLLALNALRLGLTEPPEMHAAVAVASVRARRPLRRRGQPHLVR